MNEKYENEGTREMINLATSLDPRFMLNYFSEDEIAIVQEKIINEGKLIARRIDESVPPEVDTTTKEGTLETPVKSENW